MHEKCLQEHINILVLFFFLDIMGKFGKKCRLLSMLWLTTMFFFIEIIVGYITNSMALVADSFHMLSDVAALVVAFVSVKVSISLRLHNDIHIYYYPSLLLFRIQIYATMLLTSCCT